MGFIDDRVKGQQDEDQIIDLTVTTGGLSPWLTASARVGYVESPAIRRGWRRRTRVDQPLPQGELHAYSAGDDVTACGMSLEGLHQWQDQPFGDGWLNRCPACLDRTRGT